MRRWIAGVVCVCWAVVGFALQSLAEPQTAKVEQKITLKEGWNAIWLGVAPDGQTADEVFANWPTDSVSMYRVDEVAKEGTFTTSSSEASTPRQPFAIWLRGYPAESTLQRLVGDAVYVLKATQAEEINVVGRPIARRMTWHTTASGANYFGVSVEKGVSVSPTDYLAGFDQLPDTIYRIGGTGNIPTVTPLLSSQKVKLGDVLVMECQAASTWGGAFQLAPQYGVHFGNSGTTDVITVRNDSGEARTFRLEHAGIDGAGVPQLSLWYRDPDNFAVSDAWTQWEVALEKTLAPGATWSLQVGLDRSRMGENGLHIVDTVRCTDLGRSRHVEMITITASNLNLHTNQWPAGIWALTADLETVTRVISKDEMLEGLKAHRAMPVRLIVRVDENKKMELLQRFTAASLPDGDVGTKAVVYGPLATPDASATVTARLSTPVMDTAQPCIALEGDFNNLASATWTLAPTSPSNPFRHPYHPDHDGKSADFTTAAPDGDVLANYTQPVKPELWSIGNTITLKWDTNAALGWLPVEVLTGTLTWQMTGLRAEGPITAEGSFSMSRIIEAPDYRKE